MKIEAKFLTLWIDSLLLVNELARKLLGLNLEELDRYQSTVTAVR